MFFKIRHIKVLSDKSITKYVHYLHFGFFPQAMASDYVLLAINFFHLSASSFQKLAKTTRELFEVVVSPSKKKDFPSF